MPKLSTVKLSSPIQWYNACRMIVSLCRFQLKHRYLWVGLEKCLLPDGNKEKLSDRIRFSRKSFDDTNSINVFATLKIDFTIYLFYSRQ